MRALSVALGCRQEHVRAGAGRRHRPALFPFWTRSTGGRAGSRRRARMARAESLCSLPASDGSGRQLRQQSRRACTPRRQRSSGSIIQRGKCLRRVLWRVASAYGQVRPDMGAGCPEKFDWEFLRYVWRFDRVERPRILAAREDTDAPRSRGVSPRRRGEAVPAAAFLIGWAHRIHRPRPCPRSAPPATCRSRPPDVRPGGRRGALSRVPAAVRGAGGALARAPGKQEEIVADMSAGYGAIRETFTSRVTLDPVRSAVLVEGTRNSPRALLQAREPLGVPRQPRRLRRRFLHRLRVQVDDAADAGGRPVRARLPPLHARLRGAGAGDLRRRAHAARATS